MFLPGEIPWTEEPGGAEGSGPQAVPRVRLLGQKTDQGRLQDPQGGEGFLEVIPDLKAEYTQEADLSSL